jgi:hypothetical protein
MARPDPPPDRARAVALAVAGALGVLGVVALRRLVRGPRWYDRVYRVFYALGLRVWEREGPAASLVVVVEGPGAAAPGRALDLGCGSGTDSVYLARRGWDVTGVDQVPRALDFGCFHTLPEAQREAYVAGVSEVAAPGAALLLYGFARPPRLAPMPAGLTPEEVRRRFAGAGWALEGAGPVPTDAIEVAGTRVDRAFVLWCYRLRCLPA